MKDGCVWLDGEFVAAAEARISVFDGGYLHGAGLFETMRAEAGRIFRLDSHLQRLRRSAETLLRPIDESSLPSAAEFGELLKRNGHPLARVRLTLSAGSLLPGDATPPASLSVCAICATLVQPDPRLQRQGARVAVTDARLSPSDPLSGHKTTCYLPRLLALRAAQQLHCVEALWFTTSNLLAEGCLSNVFVVRDGVVHTPPLDTPVLPGIARGVVLELCRRIQVPTREADLNINDLLDAQEVFLTNVVLQVLPVIRVEKRDIADGRVGPVTRQLLGEFQDCVRKECGFS